MKPATILTVTLIVLFSSAASFSNTELSSDEMSLVKAMQDKGVFPEDVNVEEITPDELMFYRVMLKEYGIDDIRSWKPDPKFSSPESTWSTYIEALIAGDFDLAQRCYDPNATPGLELLNEIDLETRKGIVEGMRHIEKVGGNDRSAEYLLLWDEGGQDMTYYIEFYNMFGEWKMDDF